MTNLRIAVLVPLLLACSPSLWAEKPIVETAQAAGSFETLLTACKEAGLVSALSGPGPYTVFAPTDAAFGKIDSNTLGLLLKPENRAKLQTILKYHVVSGQLSTADLITSRGLTTLSGQRVDLAVQSGGLSVDSSKIVQGDIKCTNGVIHVIDSVIMPEFKNVAEIATAAKFNTLVAAVKAAGLLEVVAGPGPITVFAPTDQAFAKLPKGTVESLLKPENRQQLVGILKYHVVPGRVYADQALRAQSAKTAQGKALNFGLKDGVFKVNESQLQKVNIEASNGVIHVIDSVLLPPKANNSRVGSLESESTRLIELAIDKGVPLFNRGEHGACAAVYEVACAALLQMDEIDRHMANRVRHSLRRARQQHDMTARAWTLRSVLDQTHQSMMTQPVSSRPESL